MSFDQTMFENFLFQNLVCMPLFEEIKKINNCIAYMKNQASNWAFYISVLLKLSTRGHCYTVHPNKCLRTNECRHYSPAVWWKPTGPWLISFYLQKKIKIHSAYKKYMLHYSLLTHNLSLGFCRLLHPSAVELGLCVDDPPHGIAALDLIHAPCWHEEIVRILMN